MPELNLKERLQPALLDRLIDEVRFVTVFKIQTSRSQLLQLQIAEQAVIGILSAQGLKLSQDEGGSMPGINVGDDLQWTFLLGGPGVSLAQLKQLVLKPPGAPQGIAVQEFCSVESSTMLNTQVESGDRAVLSMRKLREGVQRDLGWLLNSASLDSIDDLERYPEVARSVVNFGMPSFAGKALHAIDPLVTARRIREVIETFEPRLSRVQVTPETERTDVDGMTLAFRIEAELWGYPASQHLVMKTSIDIETGDVRVGDAS